MRLPALPSVRRLCSLALTLAAALFATNSATAQTSVQIHDIMVAGANPVVGTAATATLPYSPYYGQTVSVSGIVIGLMNTGDYTGTAYISEPSSSWDSLVLTAEGMPVFGLKTLNPSCFAVGDTVTIVGKVVLSTAVVPGDVTAANTPGTGILPTSCTVTATNGTMTQSISVGSVLTAFGDALKYTGMTTSATFYAVAPSTGTLNEPTETVTSTGQFWATLSSNTGTNNHIFRSAGIAGDEYIPSTAPSTVTRWAGNPQRVLIDTTTFGGSPVDITVGQSISCTTGKNITVGATAGIGLLDYTLGYVRLLIFPTSVCTVGGTVATTTSAAADSTHFKVGTLDLNRFYSTTGATTGSVAVTAAAYATRLSKATQAIVSSLGKPDIMAVQEVQDLQTLTDLTNAVNTAGSVTYAPYIVQGNDPNSLNVGFLVNTSTLVTDSVTQVEKSSTYTTTAGASAPLWERPPLVLQAEFVRLGKNYPVTVLNVHFTPRTGSGDATLGPDLRNHRAAQATDLSALVQSYQAAGDNVIVAGNLNAFEYSDGYVDVTGILDGSPAAASAVSLYEPTSTTAPLTDFATSVPATSRYNYLEAGDAVTYEHILASATVTNSATASASLASYVSTVTQPHFTTDFAADDANSSSTPAGLTPHDGFAVAFLIPPVPTTASITPASMNFGGIDLGASSAPMTATVTNTTTFTSTVNITAVTITGTNAADFTQTSTCTSLTQGSTCTVSVTFTPTAIGARTATLTVVNDSTSDPDLTIALTGTGLDTTATLLPSTLTFPATDISATSAAQTVTFTNTSTIPLSLTSATVTGDFAQTATTCTATVAAGASCTYSLAFTPTAAGPRTGTFTVVNSSTGDPTLVVMLNGTGLDTTATLTPATVTFAATDVTGTSPAQTITFTNTSAVALTIGKVSVTGDFTQTATTCTTSVAAGASCTYTLVFMPTAVGTRTGTFTVANSSTANATLVVNLTGNGLPTTATLTPTSADFGSVYAGGGLSTARVFTVTNTSLVSINLTGVTLTGNFTQTNTCGATLAAGATCTVSVVFAPLTSGALIGTLTVTDSSTANPTLVATLTGTGLPTTASLAPVSLSFGNVIIGVTSATQNVIWTNTSAIPLTISRVSVSGDYTVAATTCTGVIAANASCTVSVAFVPTALYTRTGIVTVASTSSANSTLSAALTGTGVADVEASVTSLNFGNVDLGTSSATQTFTITNYTNVTIAFTSITISGDYSYNTTCGSTIAGLSTCTVTVGFTPTGLGVRTGTLIVNTNDTKYPVITVALTGNGVDFALAIAPTSGSTLAGYTVAPTLTVTPLGGFASLLGITCTTDAGGSTCTAQTPNPTLSATINMPLTITTTSQYTVIGYSGFGGHPLLTLLAALTAAALLMRRRLTGVLPRLTLALLTLVILAGSSLGCGSRDPDKNASPTYPGTYTYTVSATDGILTHTATYTLNVAVRY